MSKTGTVIWSIRQYGCYLDGLLPDVDRFRQIGLIFQDNAYLHSESNEGLFVLPSK